MGLESQLPKSIEFSLLSTPMPSKLVFLSIISKAHQNQMMINFTTSYPRLGINFHRANLECGRQRVEERELWIHFSSISSLCREVLQIFFRFSLRCVFWIILQFRDEKRWRGGKRRRRKKEIYDIFCAFFFDSHLQTSFPLTSPPLSSHIFLRLPRHSWLARTVRIPIGFSTMISFWILVEFTIQF